MRIGMLKQHPALRPADWLTLALHQLIRELLNKADNSPFW
jgi:hypothetical protein